MHLDTQKAHGKDHWPHGSMKLNIKRFGYPKAQLVSRMWLMVGNHQRAPSTMHLRIQSRHCLSPVAQDPQPSFLPLQCHPFLEKKQVISTEVFVQVGFSRAWHSPDSSPVSDPVLDLSRDKVGRVCTTLTLLWSQRQQWPRTLALYTKWEIRWQDQGLATFSCKGPDSPYVRICTSCLPMSHILYLKNICI